VGLKARLGPGVQLRSQPDRPALHSQGFQTRPIVQLTPFEVRAKMAQNGRRSKAGTSNRVFGVPSMVPPAAPPTTMVCGGWAPATVAPNAAAPIFPDRRPPSPPPKHSRIEKDEVPKLFSSSLHRSAPPLGPSEPRHPWLPFEARNLPSIPIRSRLHLQRVATGRHQAAGPAGAARWGEGGQVGLWFSAVSGCRDIKVGEYCDARRLLLVSPAVRVCPAT